MALVRYRPFELGTLQREMNDLFDRFFGPGEEQLMSPSEGSWLPAVNVSESAANIVLQAEVPGLDPKDIDISVRGDMLTLKGEKKQEKEEKSEQWHRVERSYGTFTRSFRLPAPVVADKVAADYKNGVLRVTLPKSEQSKTREIKVKVS